jgi:hypothetical protein
MTPKEKAEELVLKYLRLQEPNYNWFHKGLAKQCALIAVDEIIKSTPCKFDGYYYEQNFKYWQEVKQEIEKL